MMNSLNKTIIISGVTSGVGRALAIRFHSLGWNVIGLARNEVKLKKLFNILGHNFSFLTVDLMNKDAVAETFKIIESKNKNIDILVNNAALFQSKEFFKCSLEDIDTIIDTNLKGVMYSTLEAIKVMKKSHLSSRIVNIGSVASIHGIKNQSIYCASKFGLNGFSEALNQEIIKDNISITTLFPGGIDTPLWSKTNPYPGGDVSKLLQPDDIVRIVELLASLEARVILKNMTIFPSNEWH